MFNEECAFCGEVIEFPTEEDRQEAYLRGSTSEAACDKCRAEGCDAE